MVVEDTLYGFLLRPVPPIDEVKAALRCGIYFLQQAASTYCETSDVHQDCVLSKNQKNISLRIV